MNVTNMFSLHLWNNKDNSAAKNVEILSFFLLNLNLLFPPCSLSVFKFEGEMKNQGGYCVSEYKSEFIFFTVVFIK